MAMVENAENEKEADAATMHGVGGSAASAATGIGAASALGRTRRGVPHRKGVGAGVNMSGCLLREEVRLQFVAEFQLPALWNWPVRQLVDRLP
jgi:hypothetical protein